MKRFFLFIGNLAASIVENVSTQAEEQPLCETYTRRSELFRTNHFSHVDKVSDEIKPHNKKQEILQQSLGGHNCTPIWRLHTKLYKGAWNVSANYSQTMVHKDLRLGKIVYTLVFYNIHFLGFFHWTVSNLLFFCCVTAKAIYRRLMGMCRWMGSPFHDLFDYNGVAFSIELRAWGRTFSYFRGKIGLHIYGYLWLANV